MRTAAAGALAAVAGRALGMCLLIQADLTSTIYLATAGVNVEWSGQTWLGISTVGAVDPINDAAGERQPLRFALSSVPNDVLAIALAEPVRGKRLRIYDAIMDIDAGTILDAPLIWSGSLDVMTVNEGKPTGQIQVTAEHRGTTFARVKPLRYTDIDQQALYPGDRSLQYMTAQSAHQDVWPAASWGKQ